MNSDLGALVAYSAGFVVGVIAALPPVNVLASVAIYLWSAATFLFFISRK